MKLSVTSVAQKCSLIIDSNTHTHHYLLASLCINRMCQTLDSSHAKMRVRSFHGFILTGRKRQKKCNIKEKLGFLFFNIKIVFTTLLAKKSSFFHFSLQMKITVTVAALPPAGLECIYANAKFSSLYSIINRRAKTEPAFTVGGLTRVPSLTHCGFRRTDPLLLRLLSCLA